MVFHMDSRSSTLKEVVLLIRDKPVILLLPSSAFYFASLLLLCR